MKYEILTENKNIEYIAKTVAKCFTEFSIAEQIGYWQGKSEKSLNITIITDKENEFMVEQVAEQIRSYNQQDAVMVVSSKVNVKFI